MKITFIATLIFCTTLAFGQKEFLGEWDTTMEGTIVEIYKVEDGWEGKIVRSEKEDAKENFVMIRQIQQKGDFWQGEIYVHRIGKWLDATFIPKGDKLELEIDAGLMTKTKTWLRVQ